MDSIEVGACSPQFIPVESGSEGQRLNLQGDVAGPSKWKLCKDLTDMQSLHPTVLLLTQTWRQCNLLNVQRVCVSLSVCVRVCNISIGAINKCIRCKGPRVHSSARGQRNHGCLKTICSSINSRYLRSFLVWRAAKPRTVSSNLFRFSPTCAKVSQSDSYRIYGFCNGNVLWTWRRRFFFISFHRRLTYHHFCFTAIPTECRRIDFGISHFWNK